MAVKCNNCGGTGDAFDFEKNDWVSPWKKCEICQGWGEVDECKQNGHFPDRIGICTVCGEEVVREYDNDE